MIGGNLFYGCESLSLMFLHDNNRRPETPVARLNGAWPISRRHHMPAAVAPSLFAEVDLDRRPEGAGHANAMAA